MVGIRGLQRWIARQVSVPKELSSNAVILNPGCTLESYRKILKKKKQLPTFIHVSFLPIQAVDIPGQDPFYFLSLPFIATPCI